jgi:hypothetical protein
MDDLVQMEHNKKAFLKALEACLGNITKACKSTGIARTNIYRWKIEDEEFGKAINEIEEVSIDFVEDKLFQRIEGVFTENGEGEVYKTPPSDTAIIFFLKTKGKRRGYIEKTEIAIEQKETPSINFNLTVTEDIGIKRKDNTTTESDS